MQVYPRALYQRPSLHSPRCDVQGTLLSSRNTGEVEAIYVSFHKFCFLKSLPSQFLLALIIHQVLHWHDGVHFDPQYFESPEEFRGDRFLDKAGNFTGRDKHVLAFSTGKRRCVGENKATL